MVLLIAYDRAAAPSLLRLARQCTAGEVRLLEGGGEAERAPSPGRGAPSVVLVDLAHPSVDPSRAIRRAREWGAPVLALAGELDPRSVQAAYLAGASAVVVLPPDPRERRSTLAGAIRFWLDARPAVPSPPHAASAAYAL